MTNTLSKKAGAFLDSEHRDLQGILSKVKRLQELNTAIANYLDANMRNFCQVANINGNHLVLIAANGSIATQIRFQTADLLKKFKTDPTLHMIESIQCKVQPPFKPATEATVRKIPPLSSKAASLILEAAQYIEDDSVRLALEKIAKNTAKKND